MRKLFISIILILFVLLPAAGVFGSSERKAFSTAPQTNNGVKWRIGYYEGGEYSNYYKYMRALVHGLMDLGWIKQETIDFKGPHQTRELWNYLSRNIKSDYIEFKQNAFYSADWDKEKRKRLSKEIIKRLNSEKGIDLMLAMGTWAGKDLANTLHSTNSMIISTSDPVGSGIVKSYEDSGFDHIHTRVDPYRYERQLRIFHNTFGFKKLGVAYENTVIGRSYASIATIEKIAKERDFEIVSCYTLGDNAELDEASKSVIDCFKKLSEESDAIYVTVQSGINDDSIPKLVEIANKHKIPTFSQFGSKEVQLGFLMSISRAGNFNPEGRFLAATAAQIFNGAKPRELNQVFEEAPNIALNLKTAEIIGIYLYADILAAADEIYREIESP